MKRSEMIKLIKKEISGYMNGSVSTKVSENILKAIEEAGMIPPFSAKFKEQNISDKWGKNTGKSMYVRVIVNEWDLEDES